MGRKILLKDIWSIEDVREYKVHFGRWNGRERPLDAWVRNREHWHDWQEYRPGRNAFSRPCIFSLMDFYREQDVWLFGGIFRVLARHEDRYEVELTKRGEIFIGRLKLRSPYRSRSTRVNFENHFDKFEVSEILPELYAGRAFPGYESIDLSFTELEALVQNDRPDWRSHLENVKGVYLITDTRTGKRYVGSAYGDQGIWSRWVSYAKSGHGGNAELRELISDQDLAYPRANFRFALLEYSMARTSDETMRKREEFWKEVLLTRSKYGLNRN